MTFIYHGRVDRRKGVLDLLDAVEGLERAHVVISGIGPDLDVAAERARGMTHVRFTGYAGYDDAPAILRQGDVFVSPTYAEGFSNTILEAMATGLPTVSTHSVGVVDCLRDEDNALLVQPGDVTGLRSALVRLRDDDALRERLATAALAEVRERYTWGRVAAHVDLSTARSLASRRPRLDAARTPRGLPIPRDTAPPMRMLALSPHLDDAVFSCGATLARLADRGARVALVTPFTRSVPDPRGFALACQTDKGLQPGIDYMALRRAEDHAAAGVLGIADVVHLDLPEAPHRGYNSAAELFGTAREDDTIDQAIRAQLSELDQPELVLPARPRGQRRPSSLIAAIPERWRP